MGNLLQFAQLTDVVMLFRLLIRYESDPEGRLPTQVEISIDPGGTTVEIAARILGAYSVSAGAPRIANNEMVGPMRSALLNWIVKNRMRLDNGDVWEPFSYTARPPRAAPSAVSDEPPPPTSKPGRRGPWFPTDDGGS